MTLGGNAVVTGASSGLGRELARQLVAERGMTVLATARRLDRLEALAARTSCRSARRSWPATWRTLTSASDSGIEAEAMPGGVDLLVNNAGMGNYADFTTQDSRGHPPDHRAQRDRPDRPEPESRSAHEGARSRADPSDLVGSRLYRHP